MMIFILAIATFAPVNSISAYPVDPNCGDYGDGSTMAMSECFVAQSEVWEKRLNVEYRAVVKRGEITINKLRKSQRAWIRYRDANCDTYNSVNGSIRAILAGKCWVDMTRTRTLELREMVWTG